MISRKDNAIVGSWPQHHFDIYGGMDYSTPAHLLKPSQWRLVQNMRVGGELGQAPRFVSYNDTCVFNPIQALAAIPTGPADRAIWLALNRTTLYQVRSGSFVTLKTGLASNVGSMLFGSAVRWSTCVHNGWLFFVNEENRVRCTNGARVEEMWQYRHCWSVDNKVDAELYNRGFDEGPFTKEPALSATEEHVGQILPGASFAWTIGTYYRVYCVNPKMFPMGSTVSITRGSQILVGMVIFVGLYHIVVKATATVAGIYNDKAGVPWFIQATYVPGIPSARHVEVFFDHLVVGAPMDNRSKVAWSHLNDYAQWTPGTDSEADSYICTEYQRSDDICTGVTGLQHYKEFLVVLTPSCLYGMQYTGLPRVVRMSPIIQDYGCGLPYGSAALDDSIVWCDVHHKSFYAWRGQGVEEFGGAISDYFFNDVCTDTQAVLQTFTYVDRLNHEVAWVYLSVAHSYKHDKAVVYHWPTNTWSVRNLPAAGISSFCRWQRRAKTCNELSGTCDAQTGIADELEMGTDAVTHVYGTDTGVIFREATAADADGTLVTAATGPVLETGDLLYGSAQKVKEVHSMTINASGTFTGIKVEISARESVGSTVVYTNVGTWTPTIKEKMITFATKAGKVLRYRFTPTGTVRDFVFHGYEDNILTAHADR